MIKETYTTAHVDVPKPDGTVFRITMHGPLTAEDEQVLRVIESAPLLLDAVERLVKLNMPLAGEPTHEELVDFWEYEKSVGRGEADDQLFVLAALKAARGSQ